MSLGLSSTSDVITFDQNWHIYAQLLQEEKIYPVMPRSDRLTGQLEPEICTEMLKKWSKKLGPKFPATTPGCSMVKVALLDDAFLEVF